MLLPVTHMLAFGAWVVAQSKVIPGGPTISISLKPPGVIPPGGSTTICCSCQCDNGNFVLYRNGHQLHTLELRGRRAEFSIYNATQEDTGAYSCHYRAGGNVLARSEILEVMVREFHLPRPLLSVLPGLEVTAGAHVTFRCTIAHLKAGCFLYIEGQVNSPVFLSEDDDFNISHVQTGNGGRYSCQCFARNDSLEWSAVSKTLELVVRDYTRSNVVHLALAAGVLVLLGVLVAEAMHSSWQGQCVPPTQSSL